MTENAQRQISVNLPEGDWQIILAGLYELPMKQSVQTFNRLQIALADAQKPPPEITASSPGPHLVAGSTE